MRRRIGLFVTITLMIFGIGLAGMLLYREKLRAAADMPNDKVVIQFPTDFDIAQKQGMLSEAQTQAWELSQVETAQTDTDTDIDRALYEEAVSLGQKAFVAECADKEQVTFAFAGDILFDESYTIMYQYVARNGSVEDTFLSGLSERMRAADVFMLNNEFPFSERGTPTEGKQFTFRANPKHVAVLEEMGVDLVSLANNHAYDYGNDALLDTFDALDSAEIPYVGAGRNLDEAMQPVYIIANGMKFAVVSATQIERNGNPDTKEATATSAGVLRCLDPSALLRVIEEAKENSDFVILYIHWGTESQEEIDWLQQDQSAVYAKAGVDLIIGDHPHCLQKIDVVEGVPVVYSLGNFWFNSKAQNSCLIEATFDREGVARMQFLPCRHENCRTRLLTGEEADGVLDYMRGISPNVYIDGNGYIDWNRS
ncbi:MAG: CapA family protein [Lachnospiraceae bacterium]|nr:CapA family protein [Lachnospiraceae bacterium]